jgi:CHAT domain-containing protein
MRFVIPQIFPGICTSGPLLGISVILGTLVSPDGASALTLEEAREKCRESVGRPTVQECMRSHGFGGGRGSGSGSGTGGSTNPDKEAKREACRARAQPLVKSCVQKAMNSAHGRANQAVAIPAEKGADVDGPAANTASFIAPPRTINDITAILDDEKPNADTIQKLRATADSTPPSGTSKQELAWFFFTRGNARAQLGRLNAATEDADKAIEVARGSVTPEFMGRLQQFAGTQYSTAGNPKQALAVFAAQAKDTNTKGARGFLFGAYRQIASIHIQTGDVAQAEAYLRRSLALIQEARTSGFPNWRTGYALRGHSWEAEVEHLRAIMFEERGRYGEAEAAYRLAEQHRRASVKKLADVKHGPREFQLLQGADILLANQARMKVKQGRLAEAEADARRALLSRLKDHGKYHPWTAQYVTRLSNVLTDQGRYQEAERLARVSIEINRVVGVSDDSLSTVQFLANLANILNYQQRGKEAAEVYAEIDMAIAKWEPHRRLAFELNGSRIYSLYATGQVEAGIAAAQALVKREIARFGEKSSSVAIARGSLAIGYARSGNVSQAIGEFRTAIPAMAATSRENVDDDDRGVIAASSQRLQNIVEAYITLLAKNRTVLGEDVALESFQLAESIRGQSVQNAVAASSARMLAKEPALGSLIRTEQDLTKQINAELGTLNNVLALPPNERDEQGVRALRASIEKGRAERVKARDEIGRKFPTYADLADPKPASAENVKGALRHGEALLSFYFGRELSFVWAVPKEGPVAFAPIAITAPDLEARIASLREALHFQAATIGEIPPFDLALAYDLYSLLLKPVETTWKSARSLIVVTNGALGSLPLSLLPTAPAQVHEKTEPPFSGYRNVSWLARSHSVIAVPSSAALQSLRRLPPGSESRQPLIGFGDPIFSAQQAAEADTPIRPGIETAALSGRGMPVRRRAMVQTRDIDSADLARLPRLPDTADELKSIALAMNTDPSKVIHLGKAANEQAVKNIDLSNFKIIVFSTHGLVPGDIDGLTQPALALTAPGVANVSGDGLLTMEEILPLKLDADWVLLSACNTGAASGAGAEAASGLGRAFFYAGSRSLLVTNWAVDSASARDLVTDIFRRRAEDRTLSRGEALQRAMIGLIDGPGYLEGNRTIYSYAHPIFWAPYSLVGDGGN